MTVHDQSALLPDNANQALLGLRRLIETEALGEDGRLPTERLLSEQFGVSRRAVRRGLEVLEAEGLVWRRQGKGTFLGQPPDPLGRLAAAVAADLSPEAVMEARMVVEPALAALCALRAGPEEVARMRALAERARRPVDRDSAELWDGALHRLIARVAGNPLLLAAFAVIDEVRAREDWQDMRDHARSPEAISDYDNQHRAIIRAIEAGNAEGARDAMVRHLTLLSRNLAASGATR